VSKCGWRPIVNIFDTEKAIAISAELPGIAKEEIALDVKENILALKGERKYAEEIKKKIITIKKDVSAHLSGPLHCHPQLIQRKLPQITRRLSKNYRKPPFFLPLFSAT